MSDQDTAEATSKPAPEKDYAALEREYTAGEYGKHFKRRMQSIEMFDGATAEEKAAAKRKWIDEWPGRIKEQKRIEEVRSGNDDLNITPGSA